LAQLLAAVAASGHGGGFAAAGDRYTLQHGHAQWRDAEEQPPSCWRFTAAVALPPRATWSP